MPLVYIKSNYDGLKPQHIVNVECCMEDWHSGPGDREKVKIVVDLLKEKSVLMV